MKMIENARLGLIDIILVKSVSRFARNLIDLLTIVREFRNKGIEIYFEEQEISSLDVKADQMITICAKFAEEEAATVSQNVKWRYTKNMREGKYTLPHNLYGYRQSKGVVTIVQEEAKWIREMFRLCLEGYGTTAIINYLNDRKVIGPTGGKWGHNTICSILRNEKYVGDCLIQKTVTVWPSSRISHKNRGEEDMMLVRNGHPAIVDRETWNKVQEELNMRATKFKVNSEHHVNVSEFTGFAYCGNCGKNFTVKTNHYYGVNGKKEKKFLVCLNNRESRRCESENIPIEEFKEGITLMTKKIKDNLPYFKELLIKGFTDVDIQTKKERISVLDKEIESLKGTLATASGKFDEYSLAIATMCTEEISKRTLEKMSLENELLIVGSSEARVKSVMKVFNSLPNSINSFDDFDFRQLYSKAFITGKDNIVLIVGNNDVSNLPKGIKGELKIRIDYKVRITEFHLNFSVYVNI